MALIEPKADLPQPTPKLTLEMLDLKWEHASHLARTAVLHFRWVALVRSCGTRWMLRDLRPVAPLAFPRSHF